MPFQVIPRELAFFDLFDRAAGGVLRAVVDLAILLDDLPNAERHAQRIRDLEHEGDDLTHQIIAPVNTTFVTPFDRKDMHRLASSLDDVIDCVEGLADFGPAAASRSPCPSSCSRSRSCAGRRRPSARRFANSARCSLSRPC